MSKRELAAFLGWCSVINITVLLLSSFALFFEPAWIRRIFALAYNTGDMRALHATLLHVDAESLRQLYVEWLIQFKVLILVFNLVPYLALKLVRQG